VSEESLSLRFGKFTQKVPTKDREDFKVLVTELSAAEIEEQTALTSREQVRCPRCGGGVNQMWLNTQFGNDEKWVHFIAECYTTNSKQEHQHHYFPVIFKMKGIADHKIEEKISE
jgi:hypothetical protein